MAKYNIIRDSMQHRFMLSRKKIQIIGGGFGNGKTAAVCVRAIKLALDYPGCNGLIARESYVKLNDTIRKEFYKWLPKDLVKRWPTKDDNTLIFKNGSVINFRYIVQRGKKTEDGFTTSNLLSATFDWIIVDQIEDPGIVHKDYLDLLGRLRGSASYKGSDATMPMTGPRWMMLTLNPTSNWCYKKLIKPYHKYLATGVVVDIPFDKKTMEPLVEVFEGATYENSHNLPDDFMDMLSSQYTGQMRDRFFEGKWEAYEGLVYPDFSEGTHMISQDEMLEMAIRAKEEEGVKLNVVECFDLGLVSPSCYLFGFTDFIGRVFWLDGFYTPTPSPAFLAQKILEIREKYFDILEIENPIWADPAIFRRTVVTGIENRVDTVAKILKRDHDIRMKPGQNDIISGIMKVSEYLCAHKGMHYDPEKLEGPLMYFSDLLEFIEAEFTGYYWRTNQMGDRIDQPMDKNDHAMDAIKYCVSKLPEASELLYRKPTDLPEYMKWQELN